MGTLAQRIGFRQSLQGECQQQLTKEDETPGQHLHNRLALREESRNLAEAGLSQCHHLGSGCDRGQSNQAQRHLGDQIEAIGPRKCCADGREGDEARLDRRNHGRGSDGGDDVGDGDSRRLEVGRGCEVRGSRLGDISDSQSDFSTDGGRRSRRGHGEGGDADAAAGFDVGLGALASRGVRGQSIALL